MIDIAVGFLDGIAGALEGVDIAIDGTVGEIKLAG